MNNLTSETKKLIAADSLVKAPLFNQVLSEIQDFLNHFSEIEKLSFFECFRLLNSKNSMGLNSWIKGLYDNAYPKFILETEKISSLKAKIDNLSLVINQLDAFEILLLNELLGVFEGNSKITNLNLVSYPHLRTFFSHKFDLSNDNDFWVEGDLFYEKLELIWLISIDKARIKLFLEIFKQLISSEAISLFSPSRVQIENDNLFPLIFRDKFCFVFFEYLLHADRFQKSAADLRFVYDQLLKEGKIVCVNVNEFYRWFNTHYSMRVSIKSSVNIKRMVYRKRKYFDSKVDFFRSKFS